MNEPSPGRCIGLIGGLGVGAAGHYYRELAKAHDARKRVLNLVMAHADNMRVRQLIEAGDKRGLAFYVTAFIGRLKAAGAEFAVIPAVAPHIAINEIIEVSTLPVVNMVAELKGAIGSSGFRRVALFGTRYAIESELFGQLSNIEVVTPQPAEIDYIHTTYFDVVDAGASTAAQHEGLTRLAHKLIDRDRVESVIFAGTDLALVFNESNTDFPHLDAAQIHLNAIVRRALD